MDFDFSCMDSEDFGLAKSFSTVPIMAISPLTNFAQKEQEDVDKVLEADLRDSIVTDGFCFKLAPG
jgi:hypothetical protein